jgi:inner membrane protein
MGIALYLALQEPHLSNALSGRKKLLLWVFLVVLAVSPDFDFLPGLMLGDANRFHHGPSHSLLGGLLIGGLAFLFSKNYFREFDGRKYFLLVVGTALSHGILDSFSKDTSLPYGVPLFWPFSPDYLISPIPLFSDVTRPGDASSLAAFMASITNRHNLFSIGLEFLFSIMFIAAIYTLKWRRKPIPVRLLSGGTLAVSLAFYVFLLPQTG